MKDHLNQAVDTEVPDGEYVNEEAWEALRDNVESEEVETS